LIQWSVRSRRSEEKETSRPLSQTVDRPGSPFKLKVDVSKFASSEVRVRLFGRELTVHGKDGGDDKVREGNDDGECSSKAERAFSRKVQKKIIGLYKRMIGICNFFKLIYWYFYYHYL